MFVSGSPSQKANYYVGITLFRKTNPPPESAGKGFTHPLSVQELRRVRGFVYRMRKARQTRSRAPIAPKQDKTAYRRSQAALCASGLDCHSLSTLPKGQSQPTESRGTGSLANPFKFL